MLPRRRGSRSAASDSGVLLLQDPGQRRAAHTAPLPDGAPEPTFGLALAAGVDLVMASGDKLLGGPQAGIIAGRADLVRQVAAHPLARPRADKVTLAGVAETLRHYARGEATAADLVWRMIAAPADQLQFRAQHVVEQLRAVGIAADQAPSTATVGGGSAPGSSLPGWCVALAPVAGDNVDGLARRLRTGRAPQGVFGRIEAARVLLRPPHGVAGGRGVAGRGSGPPRGRAGM